MDAMIKLITKGINNGNKNFNTIYTILVIKTTYVNLIIKFFCF
ncbi:hypothetical protein BN175_1650004 [Clostridioides difficile T23]|nr:hypothetical protein BN167_1390051 [Clostridioides difficile E13]CCL07825.1 hypothetical protein BN168_550185 [Clostridioides difficile CD002]CCL12128.1 hypothetical protein BN169_760017 [Clostridioides difficile E16]CCL14592.1 hypothetical protein BN170_1810071 [Clostridioides difficile T22]CCL18670.1 hypothetical protein BN171_2480045 [Clostridioides difficile E25]CCL22590.1 hypothetical protein BN172_3450005 [Clostridioides difficile T15]CCL26526.1 hypothetical protein BN173_2120048 [Cl